MSDDSLIDRRGFLGLGGAVAGGFAVSTPFKALLANTRDSEAQEHKGPARRGCSPDYGPLAPVRDQTTGLPLLLVPEGFEYLTFGWTNDVMSAAISRRVAGCRCLRSRGGRTSTRA